MASSTTPWDLRAAARALAVAVLAFGIAWIVTATTDEGGVAWGVRAGRTLPFAPVCAALGTVVALQHARARGEVRALEALGRPPWKNALAVVVGGAVAAIAAALLLGASPRVDVEGFFPVARHGAAFHYEDGAFVDRAGGWRIEADGALTSIAAEGSRAEASTLPAHGRAAAAVATALWGVALPILAAHWLLTRPLPSAAKSRSVVGSAHAWRTALSVLAMAGGSILLFHAAAAGRAPALVAPLPAALLLALSAIRYRST